MSELPLFDAIKRHLAENRSRFHTPGHSGRTASLYPLSGILPYDLTEVGELDSLYEATGVIAESEVLAARVFGSYSTLFSAGGATLCIQAMLSLAAKPGDKVLFSRNLHRSAINACALLDIHPVFAYPGQNGRIPPEEINRLLASADISAVYLTSPDYYGRLQSISEIAAICEIHNLPLLVDNAHGSHLIFFDMHPLTLGAEMTACSAHKTLPVLTGGAYLNLRGQRFAAGAKSAMAVFGSTSPSYPVLLSLELCRDWCEKEGRNAFSRLKSKVDAVRHEAVRQGFRFETELTDPVRLRFDTGALGIDARQAAAVFLAHGVQPELADRSNVVFIPTPFHTEEDFSHLCSAVKCLNPLGHTHRQSPPPRPETVLPVREAAFAAWEFISVKNSAGRVAAGAVCPCPPGIPLIIPGEKIDGDVILHLLGSGIETVKVVK